MQNEADGASKASHHLRALKSETCCYMWPWVTQVLGTFFLLPIGFSE